MSLFKLLTDLFLENANSIFPYFKFCTASVVIKMNLNSFKQPCYPAICIPAMSLNLSSSFLPLRASSCFPLFLL